MSNSFAVRSGSALVDKLDALQRVAGVAAGYCALLLVLCTVTDVTLRYLFQAGTVQVQELEWHLFGLIFLFGMGVTYQRDEHVRVDIFYAKFSERTRSLIDLIGNCVFLLPFCVLGVYTSLPFVELSYSLMEGSPDPGGLPYRFLIKAAIPIGFALLFLSGVGASIRCLLTLATAGKGE